MMHQSLPRYRNHLCSLSTSEAALVLWMGHIYQHTFLRLSKMLIAIVRANCHKTSLQLVISTSSLSMSSLDGKEVLQTVGSLRMRSQMTFLFLRDAIIWEMPGTLIRHHFWFLITILDIISRNGAIPGEGISVLVLAFSSTCS